MGQTQTGSGAAFDEETARAELYGLLAQLYYAPVSAELGAALRVAVTDAPAAGGHLEEPWRALVAAARQCTDQDITDEYIALFGGMTRPDVYLYGSHYLSGFLNEKPLAKLRGALAELFAQRMMQQRVVAVELRKLRFGSQSVLECGEFRGRY